MPPPDLPGGDPFGNGTRQLCRGRRRHDFVTVSVTDRHGVLCADRTPPVKFTLTGPALKLLAADGGDPTSLEPFGTPECRLFSGKAVVYLQSSGEAGEAVLLAESEGLKGAEINISARDFIHPAKYSKKSAG